ncbi:methyltransferase family protein [Haloactinospora alba]|uniref:Methyltransferase family protein n=1 Tax=Haloactinospora alba TaxID=405555 RepID=A0A543N7L4_9ACTN|nr:class I SAM-dependent methyltransferase [Haloactinospora alba]TQN27797.1 methyltransferase family protein [Haloactinospora alba]
MEHHHSHHAQHHDQGEHHRHDDAAIADMLDLDAEVLGSHLDGITAWAGGHTAASTPRTVADVGAGTGTGTLALARRFPQAGMVAVDQSPVMLDRLRETASARGLGERLRLVRADLDEAWPDIGTVDLAWAASSLHHAADPDRLLGDLYGALNPGGLLVVVEMDGLPRFLPDDPGTGRPGLEDRCARATAEANWNAHPNWGPHLERSGFRVAEERTFTYEVGPPAPPAANRYARTVLGNMRHGLADRLDADDLAALDRLLDEDDPASVGHRRDLTVRGSRTAWAAHRP